MIAYQLEGVKTRQQTSNAKNSWPAVLSMHTVTLPCGGSDSRMLNVCSIGPAQVRHSPRPQAILQPATHLYAGQAPEGDCGNVSHDFWSLERNQIGRINVYKAGRSRNYPLQIQLHVATVLVQDHTHGAQLVLRERKGGGCVRWSVTGSLVLPHR